MPWLYSDPSDTLCQLRGIDDEEADGAGEEEGAASAPPRKFWDGSRDRWISAVSARVDPDSVPIPAHRLPPTLPGVARAHRLWLGRS